MRTRFSLLGAVVGAIGLLSLDLGAAAPTSADEPRIFDTSAGDIAVTRIAGPFENPWALAFLPGDRLLVTERPGRLRLVSDGEAALVAGLPEISEFGQGGLMDVVAAPDVAETGLIYFSYTEVVSGGVFGGEQTTTVARGRLATDGAPRLEDVEVIFRKEPAVNSRRHFGSRIVVAGDGTLFVTLGDRAEPDEAQNLNSHIGAVVRITPDGAPPADNPFVGQADALPEIWSYGHRNAQGATLRPGGGPLELWTIEHGARGGDELNRPQPGRNYGWPVISYGRHYSGLKIGVGTEADGLEQPTHYWDPSIAPSGLAFYDGDLIPGWKGDLFAGALKFELISRLTLDGDRVTGEERLFEGAFGRIRDVRAGPDGALWFVTDESDGAVYRAAPPGL